MAEGTFSCDGKAIYDAVGLTERVEQVERNYAGPTDVVGATTYPADEEGRRLSPQLTRLLSWSKWEVLWRSRTTTRKFSLCSAGVFTGARSVVVSWATGSRPSRRRLLNLLVMDMLVIVVVIVVVFVLMALK